LTGARDEPCHFDARGEKAVDCRGGMGSMPARSRLPDATRPLSRPWSDEVTGSRGALLADTESPALELPGLLARSQWSAPRPVVEIRELPAALFERLEAVAAHAGLPRQALFLAAFAALAGRLARTGEVSIAVLRDSGTRVVSRVEITPDQEWLGLAAQLAPTFDGLPVTMHAAAGEPAPSLAFSTGQPVRPEASVDLSLVLRPAGARFEACFDHDSGRFAEGAVGRIADRFMTLLQHAAGEPNSPIGRLAILPDAERGLLLEVWNATRQPFPADKAVHALFAEQAARTPAAVAVSDAAVELSYAELDRRSDTLARILAGRGAGPGTLVGVCVERSAMMAVALLGILKTGAAYLPLDPSYPAERLRFMIEDSEAALVVSEAPFAGLLPAAGPEFLFLDQIDIAAPSPRFVRRVAADDLAYVIYTSGSTGRPKGVEIAHRSVVNLLFAIRRALDFSSDDRVLAITSISFDISVLEFFLPLLFGARLVIASRDEAADGERLALRLRKSGATFMQATPVAWRLLLRTGWRGAPGFHALCGGEAIDAELAGELLERAGPFWNVYGPTETTIWSTAHHVERVDGGCVPIGRPLANTRLYILDAEHQPVPIGAAGELFIGGVGVARGYLKRPELSAERFLADPFAPDDRARMYRTGDLARYRADGTLEFLGRIDQQVKIRGFRIEPGEIEAVLAEHPQVHQAVVVARADPSGEGELIAFIVSADPPPPTHALRQFAGRKLPPYMVPSRIIVIDALPLTPNRKTDRRRLLASVPDALDPDADYRPPRDDMEAKLVAIFEDILAVRPIGIDDNFFHLGGHSLRAVYLVEAIERQFGNRVHLNTLYYRGASAAYLASILRNPRLREPLPYLVPLGSPERRGEGGQPLFCLHTMVEGTLFFYERLADRLAPDHRLLGILPQGLEDGRAAHRSVEQMAEHALAVMRMQQPRGPYRILGFSSAGMIGFEMAQQLKRAGEEIALLALLDAYCPIGRRTLRYHKEIFDDRFRRVREMVEARFTPRAEAVFDAETTAFRALRWRHRWALRTYRPSRFDGPMTLIVAEATIPLFRERFFGWERLAREIDCEILPGGHYDLVNEPGVVELAAVLRRRLEQPLQCGAGDCSPEFLPAANA